MWRAQAVINIPLSDTFRIRAGVDHQDRHGYLKNVGHFGDGMYGNRGLGDVNYWAARLSMVADLTPDLENYTIFNYTHSQSNGLEPKINKAFAPAGNPTCQARASLANFGCESIAQMAREAPFGFWSVSNRMPDAQSASETWQVINTTTWKASDSLTVKNIVSYAEFRGKPTSICSATMHSCLEWSSAPKHPLRSTASRSRTTTRLLGGPTPKAPSSKNCSSRVLRVTGASRGRPAAISK
jgi:iron complex outermembrane receptor protein